MFTITLNPKTSKAMKLLGISGYPFSKSELISRFRSMSKQHHPDLGGTAEMFREIDNARKCLEHLAFDDVHPKSEADMSGNTTPYKGQPYSGVRKVKTENGYMLTKICGRCSGVGKTNCYCNSGKTSKARLCRSCSGIGLFLNKSGREVKCRECEGRGWKEVEAFCSDCGGSGMQTCKSCEGKGEIDVTPDNPVIMPFTIPG